MHWLPDDEAQRVDELLAQGIFEELPLLDAELTWDDAAVYDLEVEGDASFIADGFVVHNSDICRFLHGKRFSVGASMAQFARIERLRDPERIKHEQPWLQVRQDRRDNRVIIVPTERGDVRVAVVEDSAERKHTKDERGRFRNGISAAKLETINVGPPPYHGLCRSLTVPEV